jgi:hypothetical protein
MVARRGVRLQHRRRLSSRAAIGEISMKMITAAGLGLALLATPALAQMAGSRPQAGEEKAGPKRPQIDEKAYQEALKRIPEPTGPVDPWGQMRPADPAKAKPR